MAAFAAFAAFAAVLLLLFYALVIKLLTNNSNHFL
jgi:hypothetical protein